MAGMLEWLENQGSSAQLQSSKQPRPTTGQIISMGLGKAAGALNQSGTWKAENGKLTFADKKKHITYSAENVRGWSPDKILEVGHALGYTGDDAIRMKSGLLEMLRGQD